MSRTATALGVLGLGWISSLGACEFQAGLVGVNEGGKGGGQVGSDDSGQQAHGLSLTLSVTMLRMSSGWSAVSASRALPVAESGAVACRIFASTPLKAPVSQGGGCGCNRPGRRSLSEPMLDAFADALRNQGRCAGTNPCPDFCACEVPQAEGDDLVACRTAAEPSEVTNGWCYVEGGVAPVAQPLACEGDCLVFHGDAVPSEEGFYLVCSGAEPVELGTPLVAALGEPVVPSDEYRHDFAGFKWWDVTVEANTTLCESGLLVVNHFEGRVSCPYGQSDPISGECFLPSSDVSVTVPVYPQLVSRHAQDAVFCSCRCGDPDAGLCTCPSGMTCTELIPRFDLPSDDQFAGAYCIPDSTEFVPITATHGSCDRTLQDCGDPRPY